MDKEFYIEKSEEIICDPTAYQEVDANSDHKLMKIITDFIQKYSGELTEKLNTLQILSSKLATCIACRKFINLR